MAIDGNSTTWWHTQFEDNEETHPHELTVNLGKTVRLDGLASEARNDRGIHGVLTHFEIHVSSDGQSYTKIAEPKFPKDVRDLVVAFEPVDARYVKLVTRGSVDGTFASIAELNFYGDGGSK